METLIDYNVLKEELKDYEQLYNEIKIAIDTTFDQITIVDRNAKILCVGDLCEESFGISQSEIIGEDANNLVKKGIFDKSITAEVFEKREKVTIIQKTASNKKLLVTGIPIFNEKKEIVKVINISKDITSIEQLKNQIENTGEMMEWFRKELLKRKVIQEKKIITKNSTMQKIMELIKRTADVDSTVLLLGETGVGKGFLAKTIHEMSNRKNKPFVTINCGAIPENLLESELFGYEEGAFTGANKKGKKGLFEEAKDGIVFLDEIGELSMKLQVKLLSVLQDRKASRIGALRPYEIKARIIAATNKDLKKAITNGEFRQDLYYRLNIIPINIPSLRERIEDIPILINVFLKKNNEKYFFEKSLTQDAYKLLISYKWLGNIRELENIIERLVITCGEDIITSKQVLEIIHLENNKNVNYIEANTVIPLKEATKELERQLLIKAKQEYKTTRKIATVLKINQSTVVRKLKEYNI
ncbi:sigma-54 interaction domain-containing protein [Marinisporobacter balticus]|uniref:HTH-type transcriptional regulatory protein TyrR n=1 Tax=Marinisporobacter balticus TaxID=2018667 RepID=A0A4R2KL90_9FIRM|nr:sigma 54-interacting transcriptional regulator [Marinisporobacter balticus]TCO74801.1 PAS domain S-box-containing protein [Marinisporobacter balticus]